MAKLVKVSPLLYKNHFLISDMKKLISFIFFMQSLFVWSQSHKTENVIIFTLDGMRWQEVFGGIDSAIVVNKRFTHDSAEMVKNFGGNDIVGRRKKLFPFLWTTV